MTLVATRSAGWAAGFGNLLAKELGSWWRTKRWIVHLLLWLAVIAGFILLISAEERGETTPERGLGEAMQVFFLLGAFFGLIGAVLVTQGTIVGERRSGTAAWVLTKPITRKAFVLAKLVAIIWSFLLLSLVVPAIAVLVICKLIWGQVPAAAHFLEALGILALHQAFYIALALMLGTLFSSRGPVAGVALGFWIAGVILPNFLPPWVIMLMPWPLAQAAGAIATWKPVPIPLWVPATMTAVLTVIWVVIALWRFEREEF